MDKNDPLKLLTDFFESKGYIGKEAVEEAKAELERRREERRCEREELERRHEREELERRREHELQMKQTATGTSLLFEIRISSCYDFI